MDIKLKETLTGFDYKVGEVIKDAEKIFGPAQAAYLLETGSAEAVKAGSDTATAKAKTETADAK